MSRDAADHAADIIRHDFEAFHEGFRAITRRAKERFEARDWAGIRRDTVRRLALHARSVTDSLADLREEYGERVEERSFWGEVKDAYALAILGSDDFELAQSFF
ncbi:MAG: isocitrate dehydrogenase kinase/phosphatase AceK regulatory subunit, partial [Acidobacteriota bacterium]|nr:isocitrate dehydrogenase kinase/phosphatase AceK regulatory subunit [Acidobacteriota bacterium]